MTRHVWGRIEELQRQYLQEIQPLIAMKVYILSCFCPTIFITKDGRTLTDWRYPPDIQEQLDWCDAIIEDIARRYGRPLL